MSLAFFRRACSLAAVITLPAGVLTATTSAAAARSPRGSTVYTLSNESTGNRVLAYSRASDGSLSPAGSYPTGGNGSGAGLGSQGSVVASVNRRTLLAVNAGSDTVSEFAIRKDGSLRLVDTEPSGGHTPISVTLSDDTAYVLNSGSNTISGFRVDDGLTLMAGSTRSLTGTGGAQISFTPEGDQLVVTEKASNLIDVFKVNDGGRASAPQPSPSSGVTPFGFAFDHANHLLVSNAAAGAPGASSLTSYRVERSGSATRLDGPVGNTQTAACWVVVSANGRFAYTTNTGSGTVSGYRVGADGSLSLLDPGGKSAATGLGPIDATIVGRDLYTVNAGSHTISLDHVASDGSLVPAGNLSGLPASAVGLATV